MALTASLSSLCSWREQSSRHGALQRFFLVILLTEKLRDQRIVRPQLRIAHRNEK
jgi:hypothetical protein